MSVALLITDASHPENSRFVPVAPEQVFRARWAPGARALGLQLVESMETGFSVDDDNRDSLVEELVRLRAWMLEQYGAASYDIERLDRLVEELRAVRFESNINVFVG